MGKAPAFQYYVGDYIQDTRCLSLAARGAWSDLLCYMWRSETRGEITYDVAGFANLFGCSVEVAIEVLNEIIKRGVCNASVTRVTQCDEIVTIINRRMSREAKERESANNRQLRYRKRNQKNSRDGNSDAKNDGKVTSPSSSSSSSSNSLSTRESARARQSDGKSDAEKYPDWLVENEAVRMLWRQFHPEEAIPIGVQEKIAFEVTDLALWRDEVLDFWVENSHRPTSYRKMWARYRELVAKRERESSQPQARDPDHWRKHYAAELRKWLRHPMNDEQKQVVERALADLPKLTREEWSERRLELEYLDIVIV